MILFSFAADVIIPAVRTVVGCSVERVMVVCVEGDSIVVDVLDEDHGGTFSTGALIDYLRDALGARGVLVSRIGDALPDSGATVSVQVLALIDELVELRVSKPCA